MITFEEANEIADGWIGEYDEAPNVIGVYRERNFYLRLSNLIYNDPSSALRVFELAASRVLTSWAYEGLAGGPIREFLYLYPERYEAELQAISLRVPAFSGLRALAVEGM